MSTASSRPQDVQVDTKGWTWVLQRPCPECGLTTSGFEPVQAVRGANRIVDSFASLLATGAGLGERPEPEVWSPVEYSAHVADVCRVFNHRLGLMLIHADPEFPDWDQNRAAIDGAYRLREAHVVAEDLRSAMNELAAAVVAVPTSEYSRRGVRGDGAAFTVVTLLQYFLHDVVHHWWDVSGQRVGDL